MRMNMKHVCVNLNEKPLCVGKDVIGQLAEVYEQLYLAPGEASEKLYPEIVQKGEHPPRRDLSHFHTTESDAWVSVPTPAGEVWAITLCDRFDFETFLQIMGERCRKVPIPKTQGAVILDGVINHRKVEAHRAEFAAKAVEEGRPEPGWLEWEAEKTRFLSDRKNYTDALIVLSVGPYSALPASGAGYAEDEWLEISRIIREYHECTHFVCRRFFPGQIDAVWDELVADAVGIYAAVGRYDVALAERVLGIEDGRYVGGRLQNYLPEGEDLMERIEALLPKVRRVMAAISDEAAGASISPFELAIRMEARQEALWHDV